MGETLGRNKEEVATQEVDTLKSEHLVEGVRPIMACVGIREDYGKEISEIKDIEDVGHGVDFFATPEDQYKSGNKNIEEMYVISPVDGRAKFTKKLYNCTSLVAVGRTPGGEEISFLTHQEPFRTQNKDQESFDRDMQEKLRELKKRCVPGTVDVVVVGGHVHKNYKRIIHHLDRLVKEVLNFSPAVITGPKEVTLRLKASDIKEGTWTALPPIYDDVYFDTKNRILLEVRPSDQILHNESFKPGEVDELHKKWEKEEE